MVGSNEFLQEAQRFEGDVQRIPRHIMQTGHSREVAEESNGHYMRTWRDLNPEYKYTIFDDLQATQYVQQHASERERLMPIQKSTLVLFLKYSGGIYADVDEELMTPLNKRFCSDGDGVSI